MNGASNERPLLEIKDVAKRYESHQALRGVSLDMRKGEIISVLGPSGCGKSTLLQLIAGLALPDEGEIRLDGEVIASPRGMRPPEKRGVNMVFQDYALWPHLSVFDNIAYGLKNRRADRADIRRRVDELLEMLQLSGLEKRLPPQLSGGQQQRVAIARSLATQPRLLLLDEPLSNLDMRLRIEMRTEMAYLFRQLGTSVFHVTHDPEEAFAMADRLLIMRSGAVDQIGTPADCYARPASRWAASLLGAINRIEGTIVRTERGVALRSGSVLIDGVGAEGAAEGSEAEVLFRPEDVAELAVMPSGAAAETAAARPDGSGPSEGRTSFALSVLHSTFEGKRWRIVAKTDAGHKLYLIGDRQLPPGAPVAVSLPKAAAYIYAKTQEGSRPS
ncbi:ABC transporter ATP-binding protein [Cohnella hongkongensis]|uniref:ABC transporter ATP-binding protein n=1 Tax=Cohnella hongkongensis TaxID=178337 RepID=A0ABV9FKP5_9BACL